MAEPRDRWAQWLLQRRHGGDAQELERMLPRLAELRDRVIANATINEGDVVLDVGAGNGLIGLAAVDLVGESGRVVLSDISLDLLDECRRAAAALDVLDRCDFVEASADSLPLERETVDVVTTRSVLIYLMDKARAFREFHRVLRTGGRLSIFEPVNIFGHDEWRRLYYGLDVSPVQDLADKIAATWRAPDDHPLLNFDERDLIRFAREAGFVEITLDYHAEVALELWTRRWQTFLRSAGNPLDPTPEEEMNDALSPRERARFQSYVRPLVESQPRVPTWRAAAYVRAVK